MYVHSRYTESACTRIATHLDRNFSSSIVRVSSHKRLHISEMERAIDLKVSSNVVLLTYIAIAIFVKNLIRRVFPDSVTYVIYGRSYADTH